MNESGTPRERPAWSTNENNSWARPDPLDALLGRDGQLLQRIAGAVGQPHPLQVGPQALYRVHIRRVGRELRDGQPGMLVGQPGTHRQTGVGGQVVPHQGDRRGDVTSRPSAATIGINCSVSSAPSHRLRRRVAPCDRLEPLKQTS